MRRWRKYRAGHQPRGEWAMWSSFDHGHAIMAENGNDANYWINNNRAMPPGCVIVWVSEEVPS